MQNSGSSDTGKRFGKSVGLVSRAEEYSPGLNVEKDAAILEQVAWHLQQAGCQLRRLSEEDLLREDALRGCDCLISMARRQASLMTMQRVQRRGMRILNRPSAVMVTVQSRSTTLEMLQIAGLPVAPFWSYEPAEDQSFLCEPELQRLLPGWVKGMHPKGVFPMSVVRVETPLEADAQVLTLVAAGYTDIVVTRHLEGPLLKVYAVGNKCWVNSGDVTLDAATLATILQEIVPGVRRQLGLDILGIDLILTEEGPYIIDVNDFPSFSCCRDEASQAIAGLGLIEQLQ